MRTKGWLVASIKYNITADDEENNGYLAGVINESLFKK